MVPFYYSIGEIASKRTNSVALDFSYYIIVQNAFSGFMASRAEMKAAAIVFVPPSSHLQCFLIAYKLPLTVASEPIKIYNVQGQLLLCPNSAAAAFRGPGLCSLQRLHASWAR